MTFSLAARETIAQLFQQALDTHDVSESARTYTTIGIIALGASLNLMGFARDFLDNSDNLKTRAGRLSMIGLTLATALAAGMQGKLGSMAASTLATTVYSLLRDVTNQFYQLKNNVQSYSLLPTGAAAAIYGVFGGVCEYVGSLVPGSDGSGNSAFYVFGAFANTLSALLDDAILAALNYMANPEPGNLPLRIRGKFCLPAKDKIIGAVTTQASLRMGAIQSINCAAVAILACLAEGDEPHSQAVLIGAAVVAVMMMVIYGPFVAGTLQGTGVADSEDRAGAGRSAG